MLVTNNTLTWVDESDICPSETANISFLVRGCCTKGRDWLESRLYVPYSGPMLICMESGDDSDDADRLPVSTAHEQSKGWG